MAPSDPSWNLQDPASKERVLNGGTARGDEELAGKFRDLFFAI